MKRSLVILAVAAITLVAQSSAVAADGSAAKSRATAPQNVHVDSAELAAFKRAIRLKYDLQEQAFAAQDAEPVLTRFYTPDVISVIGNPDPGIRIGTEQLRPLLEHVVKDTLVKIESVHTFVKGKAGWDWADFQVSFRDGKTPPFTFAVLFLWTKVNGDWMCKGHYTLLGSFRDGALVKQVLPHLSDEPGAVPGKQSEVP